MRIEWRFAIALGSVLLGLVAATASCGGGTEAMSTLESNFLTRSPEGSEAEMDALIRGTLEIDSERGCIALSGRLVVWPAGSTLTLDPAEVHLPGGLRAVAGDEVAGRGGEVPAASIRQTALQIEGDLDQALECVPFDAQVVVFSTRGDNIAVSPAG